MCEYCTAIYARFVPVLAPDLLKQAGVILQLLDFGVGLYGGFRLRTC